MPNRVRVDLGSELIVLLDSKLARNLSMRGAVNPDWSVNPSVPPLKDTISRHNAKSIITSLVRRDSFGCLSCPMRSTTKLSPIVFIAPVWMSLAGNSAARSVRRCVLVMGDVREVKSGSRMSPESTLPVINAESALVNCGDADLPLDARENSSFHLVTASLNAGFP